MVKNLLRHNNIFNSPSTRDETSLEQANNVLKERAKPVNQNLSNDLVNNITKTDGLKIPKVVWLVHLRNERNEGLHNVGVQKAPQKNIINQLPHLMTNQMPICLKKMAWKPSGPRALKEPIVIIA